MIEKLPRELQSLVFEQLSDDFFSILQLSKTCKACRSMLEPILYRSVYLQSTPRCAASVKNIAYSPLSKYVKELHFQGRIEELDNRDPIPGPERVDYYERGRYISNGMDYINDPSLLPSDAEDVISSLHLFPELETLSVEFFFTHEEFEDVLLDLLAEAEDPQLVDHHEAENSWRALMAKTWNAVAKNQKGVKRLEIRRLHIREVSTFASEAWHRFLHGVKEFHLSTWGGVNGACFQLSKMPDYPTFMGRLDEFFYNHLNSVTDLAVMADRSGSIGDTPEWRMTPFGLKADHVPLLQKVHFEYVQLCPDLREFLESHMETLTSITLHDCWAFGPTVISQPLTWGMLFTTLEKTQPTKLRYLQISWSSSNRHPSDNQDEEEDTKTALSTAKKPLQSYYPILFPYTDYWEKYGDHFVDDEETSRRFLSGEDQISYDRLMERVRKNAYRFSKEGLSNTESGFNIDHMAEPSSVGMIFTIPSKGEEQALTPIAESKASFAPEEFNPRYKQRMDGAAKNVVPDRDQYLSSRQIARLNS